jgi:hypothetical protein
VITYHAFEMLLTIKNERALGTQHNNTIGIQRATTKDVEPIIDAEFISRAAPSGIKSTEIKYDTNPPK